MKMVRKELFLNGHSGFLKLLRFGFGVGFFFVCVVFVVVVFFFFPKKLIS